VALPRIVEAARKNARAVNDRVVEAAAVGAAGAALGAGAGALVGLAGPAAAVAATNGVISGFRKTYDWRTQSGRLAFVLDSSWALVTTAAGLISQLVGVMTRSRFDEELSERSNRHVYERGFVIRRNFAVTVGNVVSGAGDTRDERRRHLVTDHEDVHIWQARVLGPLFPVIYVGWMIVMTPFAVMGWARGRLSGDRSTSLWAAVDRCAYWRNPLERQAYLRASQASEARSG
jgi:hypothetical protein